MLNPWESNLRPPGFASLLPQILRGCLLFQSQVRDAGAPGWNIPHTSASYGCSDCFSYSVEDLCSHETSDHNYFGVCQGILAPNAFSLDIPQVSML